MKLLFLSILTMSVMSIHIEIRERIRKGRKAIGFAFVLVKRRLEAQ